MGDEDIPEPRAGLDENFDAANQRVDQMKFKLNEYLQSVIHKLVEVNPKSASKVKQAVCFAHARYRYEIEVPADLVSGKKKPKDFFLTSQKQ